MSIRFLLAWTIWTAILLAIYSRLFQSTGGPTEENQGFSLYRQTSSVVESFLLGAVLAGAGALVSSRRRMDTPLAWAPGHFVLFARSSYVLFLATYCLFMLIPLEWRPLQGRLIPNLFGIVALVQGGWLMLGVMKSREQAWRIALGFLGTTLFVRGLVYAIPSVAGMAFTGDLITATWVMGCMFIGVLGTLEAVNRVHRDWLHWLGVVSLVIDSVTSVVWRVWIRYIFPG